MNFHPCRVTLICCVKTCRICSAAAIEVNNEAGAHTDGDSEQSNAEEKEDGSDDDGEEEEEEEDAETESDEVIYTYIYIYMFSCFHIISTFKWNMHILHIQLPYG